MINSRDIAELTPDTADKARKFEAACGREGIDVLFTSTYRDYDSQAKLYAQGRTTPGNTVTDAGPGKSFHNWRVAFDFVPIVAGKAQWDDQKLWAKCGVIAESLGLEWGGRWKRTDKPHCQNTQGYSINQFMTGEVSVK